MVVFFVGVDTMASTPPSQMTSWETDRDDSVASSPRFLLLQEEITVLKEELKSSEDTYQSKRTMLEEEAKNTRVQYKNKVSVFQDKFAALADETRKHESNYKAEVSQVKEQVRVTEEAWHDRLDHLEQTLSVQKECRDQEIATLLRQIRNQAEELNDVREAANANQQYMSKEYVKLHLNLETLQRTSEKGLKETDNARLNFERARVELIDTLNKRQEAFRTLQHAMQDQAVDIQAVRNEAGVDKEELELMIQSWMTQHDQLNQQVQDQAQELKLAQENILTANDERNVTRHSVRVLGETWETLFEHLVEQVQDQADNYKANTEQHEAFHDELAEKIDTSHLQFENKVYDLEGRSEGQEKVIQNLHEQMGESAKEIVLLQQSVGIANSDIGKLEGQLSDNSKRHASTKSELDGLRLAMGTIDQDNKGRFNELKNSIEENFVIQASTSQLLQSTKNDHSKRFDILENSMERNSAQLVDVESRLTVQAGKQDGLEMMHRETQQEILSTFETRNAEFETLSTMFHAHTHDQRRQTDELHTALAFRVQATDDLGKQASQLVANLASIEKRVEKQAADHTIARDDFAAGHSSLGAQIEQRINQATTLISDFTDQTKAHLELTRDEIVSTLKEHTDNISVHGAKLSTFGPQIQQLIQNVTEQAVEQEAASEARTLIADELVMLKENVQVEDEKIRRQIEDQASAVNKRLEELNKTIYEQEEDHISREERLSQSIEEVSLHYEAAIRDVATKVEASQTDIEGVKQTLEEHSSTHGDAKVDRDLLKSGMVKLATEARIQNCTLVAKIDEHVQGLCTKHGDLMDIISVHRGEHEQLDAKVEKANAETVERHEIAIREVCKRIDTTSSDVQVLTTRVDKHGDDINTSKEARSVIRSDLKKMMQIMNTQDGKLLRQIEETSLYIKDKRGLFKSMLSVMDDRQSMLDEKLEKYRAAAKDHCETLSTDIDSKLEDVIQHAKAQKLAIQSRAYENTKAMIENQSSLYKEDIGKHTETFTKVTSDLRDTVERMASAKVEAESKLVALRTAFEEKKNIVQRVEEKVADFAAQMQCLEQQVATQNDASNVTKEQIAKAQGELGRLTECQILHSTQYEHLLTRVNVESQEKAQLTEALDGVSSRCSLEEVESLTVKMGNLLQEKDASFPPESPKAEIAAWIADVQQQLQQVQNAIKEITVPRPSEPIEPEESMAPPPMWSTQLEAAMAQIQSQASELKALKDDRDTMYEHTNTMMEQLQTQFQMVSGKFGQEVIKVQRVTEERDLLERHLEEARTENKNLGNIMAGLKGRQKKYKTDVRKRQGQLKALMADNDTLTTSAELPRDVCFAILEEESRDTAEGSFHSLEEAPSRE